MYCCKTSKTGYSFRKFSLRDIIRLSGTVFYTFQRVRVKVWNFNLIFYNSEPICMRSFGVSGHLSAFIPSGWFTNLKASAVGIMVPTSHRGMYLISPAPRLLRWKLAVDIIRYKLCGHPITGHIVSLGEGSGCDDSAQPPAGISYSHQQHCQAFNDDLAFITGALIVFICCQCLLGWF